MVRFLKVVRERGVYFDPSNNGATLIGGPCFSGGQSLLEEIWCSANMITLLTIGAHRPKNVK